MCHRIKPRNDENRVPNGPLCKAIAYILIITFLFPISSSLATGARASDLTFTDNVTITLNNHVKMLNIFLSPGASNIISAIPRITTTVSKRPEMPQTRGKLIIAGGVGKRILTVSAEIYDADTRSWLTKGNLSIGRGRSFSPIPFNSSILLWAGMIIPF